MTKASHIRQGGFLVLLAGLNFRISFGSIGWRGHSPKGGRLDVASEHHIDE